LAVLACFLQRIFRYILIVDAHNGAIVPDVISSDLMSSVYNFVQRKADITIVTNEYLAGIVRGNNGTPFVLPDRLPDIDCASYEDEQHEKGIFAIVFICSFDVDEPFEEVFAAFLSLALPETRMYVPGRADKTIIDKYSKFSNNIVFTGFLSDKDYFKLLCEASLVIDLTTRENCIVCGAYEAISAGVPVIVSSTKVMQEYFRGMLAYTNNSSSEISKCINSVYNNYDDYLVNIINLKRQLYLDWNILACHFNELLMKYI
jgi:glycosyltransferase involved in cell wall biosynthesis